MMQESGQTLSSNNVSHLIVGNSCKDLEDHVLALSCGLNAEQPVAVIVLTAGDFANEAFCRGLEKNNVKLHWLTAPRKFSVRTLWSLKKILANEKTRILHTHQGMTHPYGYLLSRWDRSLRWFSTLHDADQLGALQSGMLKCAHWRVFTTQTASASTGRDLIRENSSVIEYGIAANFPEVGLHSHPAAKEILCDEEWLQGCAGDVVKKAIALIKPVHGGTGKAYLLPATPLKMPLSLLRAMRQGIPIVAYDGGVVLECLVDRESVLLVRPGDSYQLGLALKSALQDTEIRTRLIENARRVFEEKFTAERMVERYRVLYRMV